MLVTVSISTLALLSEAAFRATISFHMSRNQPPGTDFEIYGVGESTLIGEPFDPKISVPRMLEHMFGGTIAGRTIVIKNLAQRGSPLYPQSIAFERAVASRDERNPGVALIVSGHNEGIEPGIPDAPPSLLSRVAEKSALLGEIVLALQRHQLLRREKTLGAYEHYLRRVIENARQTGLVPILTTMASNISRIEPNCDVSDGEAVGAIIAQGNRLEQQHDYAAARDLYINSVATHRYWAAVLHYRAGRCEEALGDFAAAREDFWRAVDMDRRTMFGRATRPQNELLRRLAREYRIPLVDAVQIFEVHSPHGILGDDLFMDGQHPTIEGYLLMANAYAQILTEQFGARVTQPLPDVETATAAFGYEPRDAAYALVDAGSWLIATSVGHPFPEDRMALAAKRFTSVIGKGDDFSAWLGIAITQAATRGGGMLSSPNGLAMVGAYTKSYQIPAAEFPGLLARLQQYGVDGDVIDRLKELRRG
jgi:lysophospholipase L1-like esterase